MKNFIHIRPFSWRMPIVLALTVQKVFTWFRIMLHIKDSLFVKPQEEWYPIHFLKRYNKNQLTTH